MNPEARKQKEFFLLFMGTWLFLSVFFPVWSPPVSVGVRSVYFGILLVHLVVGGTLLWFLLGKVAWTEPAADGMGLRGVLRGRKSLSFLLGIALILHLFYVFAVPAGYYRGDEPYHVFTATIYVNKADALLAGRVLFPSVYLFRGLVLIVAAGLFFCRRMGWEKVKAALIRCVSLPGLIVTVFLVVGWFWFVIRFGIRMPMEFFEYPPLGGVLYFLSFAIFGPVTSQLGVGEFVFAARLVQVGFSLAGALMVFYLTRLYRDERTAVLAAGIYLFIPVSFFFGNTADYASGTLFFLLTVAYWFLKSEKTGRLEDLLMAIYFVGLGYNYKRVLIYTVILFWIYWGLSPSGVRAGRLPWRLLRFALSSWIALVPILPGFYQSLAYSARGFGMIPGRLLNFTDSTIYLRLLSIEVTQAVFALFIVGAIWGVWRRRDAWTRYLLIWFFLFYGIFTSWPTFPNYRFMFYFVPPVVMLAAQGLRDGLAKINKPRISAVILCALFGFLIYIGAFLGLPPPKHRTDLFASDVEASSQQQRVSPRELGGRRGRRYKWWAGEGKLNDAPWYAPWRK